ncbi:dihydrofolate reductase family protein [Cohnella rhizosphaerae]|uniref:Dihydrofolate reductase family protein n=1 Tax=Cohnella rhizosphaerae TaxID=1457232 RepID=A0A9X4QTD9_9BACL|nr:dihydrofolate reductase family protein [Cohnella rhizosphaerae]MDG0811046.1 dihydrofolate reductase family protein [Cohnella rhizosphaerae]
MRKIKMLNRISIDGYFASPNEENFGMDWFVHDPEVDRAAHEMGGSMNTLMLGGATFRGFERYWLPVLHNSHAPSHDREIAAELAGMTKIVFSRTLAASEWANTRFYDQSPSEVARQLKHSADTDILVLGSGSIVRQLARDKLIDEFIFIVTPVVAGAGKTLFPDRAQIGLTLIESRAFESGNLLTSYALDLER